MSSAHLESLYNDHASALFGFAMNLTRDESVARDVLQEVFIRLAQSNVELSSLEQPRSYLIKMAHRIVIDLSRRDQARGRKHEALSKEASEIFESSTNLDEDVFRKALSVALVELPLEQREVVHLKLWEGLVFEEIAHILEISPNTAASRYRYGLDKLRALLRPLYDEIK